jgi:hypothetical protein
MRIKLCNEHDMIYSSTLCKQMNRKMLKIMQMNTPESLNPKPMRLLQFYSTSISVCSHPPLMISFLKKENFEFVSSEAFLNTILAACHDLVNSITDSLVLGSDSQFHCNFLWTINSKSYAHKNPHIAYIYTR